MQLQGIPSTGGSFFGSFSLDGIRKYRSFLLNGIYTNQKFPIRRICLLLPILEGQKYTIIQKKKFPIRPNRNLKKFPITLPEALTLR